MPAGDSPLSLLTSAAAFTGSELFYTVQGGNDRKATSSQIYQYITTVSTLGAASVVPSALTLVSDTNVTLSPTGLSSVAILTPVTATVGWAGTLSSARLNVNVVQTVTNDTNVTGAISSQNLTLGWTGVLPSSRIGTIGSSQIVGGVGGTPGGVSGNIQFNSSGVFSGILNSSWDPVNSLFSMQANTLTVLSTIATEKFRIDNVGLITNGGPNISIGPSGNCLVEVFGDGSAFSGQAQISLNNNNSGLGFVVAKTRGTSPSSNVIVQVGDNLGAVLSLGNDGTGYVRGSAIQFDVDAAPAAGSMPTNIRFQTVQTGAVTRTERMRIDSNGVVIIGGSSALLLDALSASPQHFQMQGIDIPTASAGFARWSAGSGGPKWFFAKSRGASVGTHAAVAANDQLALVYGNGDDGTQFIQAGLYSVEVDGAVAANTVPGRLGFYTASGAGVIERMRIDSYGSVWLMNNLSSAPPTPAGAKGNVNETVALFNHHGMGGI